MQPIIYDVAVSIDGFICGPAGDISRFAQDGEVVEDYKARLQSYATAIMGRETYEFGYRFGMQPGQNPYPHMKTIVFSRTLKLGDPTDVVVEPDTAVAVIEEIRDRSDGPVYLCGGGAFAGALLSMGLVDILRLKRAPILLGDGVPLFLDAPGPPNLRCIETRIYEGGYLFQEFEVVGG